jgi:DnaJ family protein C protein 7
VQQDAEQAEAFKNEGNKFFKAGDYTRALEFYTKGEFILLPARFAGSYEP